MMDDKAWLNVGAPIHPRGVKWGRGRSSLPWESVSLRTFLCALGLCHAETGPGLSRTDADGHD